MTARSRTLLVIAALAVLAGVLVLTAVPAPFIIDDNNYIATVAALKAGGWALPGTAGLPPSIEWYAFDPFPELRGNPRVPLIATSPPWFAVLALPFEPLGLHGFVLLNALGFIGALIFTHRLSALYARDPRTPYLAAAAVGLGGFTLEYAQSIWPHMVSLGLVTGAMYFAARARRDRVLWSAGLSGFFAATAAGVRYQNGVLLAVLGLGVVLFHRQRLKAALVFGAAALLPLAAAAAVNASRLGLANPVTKGHGYAQLSGVAAHQPTGRVQSVALSFYTRLVDFSVHPPIGDGPNRFAWEADPDLGVFMAFGAMKKALLQSAPWFALALALLLRAWSPRTEGEERDEARAMSLLPAALIALFSAAGVTQHDGLCFNQRYFFEALPAAAIALAWWQERLAPSSRSLMVGALAGLLLAAPLSFADPGSPLRVFMLRFVPLILAALLLMPLVREQLGRHAGAPLVVAAIAFSFVVHLVDDLPASRRLKSRNAESLAMLRRALPPGSALATYAGARDAAWPLMWLEDVWVFDLWLDGGKDGPTLIKHALASGRRVFVHSEAVPLQLLEAVSVAANVRPRVSQANIVELVSAP